MVMEKVIPALEHFKIKTTTSNKFNLDLKTEMVILMFLQVYW